MARGKWLNQAEKAKISALKDNTNLPVYKIAQKINRSEKVVRNYLKDRENYGKKSPLVVVRLSQSLKNVDSFEVPPIV